MTRIKSELLVSNNNLNSYFAARTSMPKEGDFDWGIAKATVVRNLYRKDLSTKLRKNLTDSDEKEKAAIDLFRLVCERDFKARLDDERMWEHIQAMYFRDDSVYELAPEALLFKLAPLTGNSSQHRLADMFTSLMRGQGISDVATDSRNFLEEQLVTSLKSENILEEFKGGSKFLSKGINEEAYLPFLSDLFNADLEFLAKNPKYFLDQIENTLRLYGYLYTAQLALNIMDLDGEPTAKPLYFIMESETASKERVELVRNGHQLVQKFLQYIFPYLSMSESLQEIDKNSNEHRLPLWKLAKKLEQNDAAKLRDYARAFAEDRFEGIDFVFPYNLERDDPRYWLDALLAEALAQFDKRKKRASAQEKFIKSTENELCSIFVRSRGQAGKVLVLNQDYITLLTNLSVGISERLRFHELIKEFNKRGIYFDKQSQKALIRFYERVGNVERMSDSGDAVYVRKTL
jgi:DNA phosphorothioation-dependent restriction protein DptG